MKPLRLLLLCLLPLPLWSEAQTAAVRDSLGILRRAEFHNAPLATLDASAYESSPAAMLYRYPVSYSTLRLQGDLRSESRPILQPEGDGALVGTFRADSYLRLDERSVVTAGASYERGRTDNVRWNSTADYRLLRPFVLADSVGGDLSTEEYAFRGAYVRRDGRINYGIGIDYRARHEFRQVDPRPHNIVNDLTGTIGAGFSTDRSLIALTARGRIYKQSQEVGFFDERGANTVEFLMTGLGNYFARYVGGEDQSLFYKGKGYALSLTAVPSRTCGWSALLQYERFSNRNIFSELNYAPAGRLVTQTLSGSVARRYERGGFAVEGSYELRQGFENVVDNGETADYRILGEFAMYRNRTLRLTAGGMVTWNRPQTDYTLAPSVGYFRTSADYPYPKREISLSTASAGCDLHLTRHGQRGTLRATVGGRYAVNLTRHTLLSDSRLDPDIGAMLFDSVDRMTADAVELTAALRAERELRRSLALFVDASWRPGIYMDGVRVHLATIACGICF